MPNPYFSPQSMYWRVNREWLIALAGPRAVMLELAHPAIMAGVAQHSRVEQDPFGRLHRTMKTMTQITFGKPAQARAALSHFHHCHAPVHGTLDAGATYNANDPQLKLWVWATLVDSVLRVYNQFVQPLTPADTAAYYDDALRLARLLGIPNPVLPPTVPAFDQYMTNLLAGDTLRVTPQAHAAMQRLFAPTLIGKLARAASFVSIGMLPETLRAQYGYSWDERREHRLTQFAALSRRLRPHLPDALAVHPKARAMERAICQTTPNPQPGWKQEIHQ